MPGTIVSILGIRPRQVVDRVLLRRLYRKVVKAYHPDAGGSDAEMARASVAYAEHDAATLLTMLRRHRARKLLERA